jgi:hypothetical protein
VTLCKDCKHWREGPSYCDWSGGAYVIPVRQGQCCNGNSPTSGVTTRADFGCVMGAVPVYVVPQTTGGMP